MGGKITYQRKILSVILTAPVIMLVACGNSNADAHTQIDALEVEDLTHVKLNLTDDLDVDASVTPYEQYKDGLAVYYVSQNENGGDVADILFGKDVSEQFRIVVEYLGRDYDESLLSYDTTYRTMSYMIDGDKELCAEWCDVTEEGDILDPYLDYPFGSDLDYGNTLNNILSETDISSCLPQLFGDAIADVAEAGKEMVAELTGQELADTNLCIPLTEAGDDAYAFVYPFKLDDFPWNFEGMEIQLNEGVELSEEAKLRYTPENSTLKNLYCRPALIYYMGGEVVQLLIPQFVSVDDTYQEDVAVIDACEVLDLTVDYFDKVLVEDKVVIDSIELAYNVYATDGSDGEVRYIAAPFWYVRYREGDGGSCYLVFLAQTGECMGVCPYAV